MSRPAALRTLCSIIFAVSVTLSAVASIRAQQTTDTLAIRRIQAEGLERSEVMETARVLTDIYGPRLTGSPLDSAAGAYAMQRLRTWGVSNVHGENFAFDKPSWMNRKYYVQVTSPSPFPVLGMAAAWSAGTDSLVHADAMIVRINVADDTLRFAGRLRNKVVLVNAPLEGHQLWPAPSIILTPELLDEMARTGTDIYATHKGLLIEVNAPRKETVPDGKRIRFADIVAFLNRQGVAAILRSSAFGSAGNFTVADAYQSDRPEIEVAPEHYSRIYRTLESGLPVQIDIDVRNEIGTSPARPFNVISEIPGTDLKDEIVMIGAHLDSWAGGTGATDNAAGSATMLEAMRILKATRLPLRRTVRIALWNGEEQGMVGSLAYVREHFGAMRSDGVGKRTFEPGPEFEKFDAYFNLDTGAGLIRAIDSYKHIAAQPMLQKWVEILSAMSMPITHVTAIGNDPSDDDIVNAIGPGFYFQQDPLDYYRGTHHTSQDLFDRLVPQTMKQNAVIIAAMVYLAANADTKVPR